MFATSASCGTAATSSSAVRFGEAAPSALRFDAIVPPVEKTATLGRVGDIVAPPLEWVPNQ